MKIRKGVAEIKADVCICIDEIGLNDSEFLLSEDNEDMESIIESKIPDALRFACLNADKSLLEPTEIVKGGSSLMLYKGDSPVCSYVTLPLEEDFLRLCYAKMSDWDCAVTTPILYTDKEYMSLKNPITTGYPDNPKVAIVEKGVDIDGAVVVLKHLELYTSNGTGVIYAYIGEPKMEDGRYSIPSKIYRGVIYYISALTLMTYKDPHAESLFNQSMIMLGINK